MRLLLAGMESSLDMAIKHNVKDILVSALYMHKKKSHMDIVLEKFDFVFLDSGAFTFWNKWESIWEGKVTEKYGADKINDTKFITEVWRKDPERKTLWDAHWAWGKKWEEEYLAMLKSDKRFLDRDKVHVVEFDVGNEEQMTERRKRFEKEGFNVVPVFHPNDSEEYAKMLMRDYDYIGIGGIAVDGGKMRARHFQQHFQTMKKYQTKIHGLNSETM